MISETLLEPIPPRAPYIAPPHTPEVERLLRRALEADRLAGEAVQDYKPEEYERHKREAREAWALYRDSLTES